MLRFIQPFAGWLHRWTFGWFARPKPPKRDRRQQRLHMESLEDRRVFAAGFAEFVDPHPAPGNQFGAQVIPLSTGNVVITSPFDDAGGTDAGAVYLFSGRTGKLISTLTGSTAGDHVGSGKVVALTNGNFVVVSPDWDRDATVDASAVTWGSGTEGVKGIVSAENSMVGSNSGDKLGTPDFDGGGVTALSNGNYVVASPSWNNGFGAVTFGNGMHGTSVIVSVANSLVGTKNLDSIGSGGVTALTNGNYVVVSPRSRVPVDGAGAVTFGDGMTGISGQITSANSLVGTKLNDVIGDAGVIALPSGNYLVKSKRWDNGSISDAGAVTFANGSTGITGSISAANSLIGNFSDDQVGGGTITVLTNGNYVVNTATWNFGDRGAVTFGSGMLGVTGEISASNSLIGKSSLSPVGFVLPLTNGNYVVSSATWDYGQITDAGAVTFGDGTTGISGEISEANSLIGNVSQAFVSVRAALANGNYVIGLARASEASGTYGGITLGNGTTGTTGILDPADCLLGVADRYPVGPIVTPLSNGNFVLVSPGWNNTGTQQPFGALTFASGTEGITGVVSAANSLVGTQSGAVGSRVMPLTNGNYVVIGPDWNNGSIKEVGAATFGNGTTGVVGLIDSTNSLIGDSAVDLVGRLIVPLKNGNYVVGSKYWDNGSVVDVGAVTFGDGTTGVSGHVSGSNSLVGTSANDQIGSGGIVALPNGNYVVNSPVWDNGELVDAGAVTFGTDNTTIFGTVESANSAWGQAPSANLQPIVVDPVNETFYAIFLGEAGGRVRVGSQIDGFSHPWHLAVLPADVNNDGQVVAEDVLTIINYINAGHPDDVPSNATLGGPYGFLDVTGDGHVVAEDVIEVINYINAGHSAEGEAHDQVSSAMEAAASAPAQESAASVPSTSFAPAVINTPAAAPDLNDSLLLLLASDASSAKKRR